MATREGLIGVLAVAAAAAAAGFSSPDCRVGAVAAMVYCHGCLYCKVGAATVEDDWADHSSDDWPCLLPLLGLHYLLAGDRMIVRN